MRVNKSKWKMTNADFGPLLPYVLDENVTDINYNGSAVWIDDLTRGRYRTDITLHRNFIERFTTRVADAVSETFNQYNPLLEAETDTLRISIVHEEYANTGRSISIRKTPVVMRLNRKKMLSEDYCTEEFLDFIENCVAAKMNILMCGAPGTGKTEFLKYLTKFIPAEDRVITIEDNLEIHYSEINPGKDCVELKVDGASLQDSKFSYVTAIKACLRQNPQWILLSEARSTEVKHLIESMSTGTHCLTTIHTDDVRKVPDRIKNMIQDSVIAASVENDVFSFLDAAILIKKKSRDGKIYRYIDQMCFFSREDGSRNELAMIVNDGKFVSRELPSEIMHKFAEAGILNPFALKAKVETESGDEEETDSNVQSSDGDIAEIIATAEKEQYEDCETVETEIVEAERKIDEEGTRDEQSDSENETLFESADLTNENEPDAMVSEEFDGESSEEEPEAANDASEQEPEVETEDEIAETHNVEAEAKTGAELKAEADSEPEPETKAETNTNKEENTEAIAEAETQTDTNAETKADAGVAIEAEQTSGEKNAANHEEYENCAYTQDNILVYSFEGHAKDDAARRRRAKNKT